MAHITHLNTGSIPAAAGRALTLYPASLFNWIKVRFATWHSARAEQRLIRQLRQYEPHLLRDINVSRAALFGNPPKIMKL